MARMRSLKPEFWLDRKLARRLSRDERMLYLGLWNQADEWARANGDPRVIKGQVFPFDDDLTLEVLEVMLKALETAGVAVRYEVDGDPYLFLPKLGRHQRLEPHKVPSRFPAPPEHAAGQQVHTAPGPRAEPSASDPGGAQTGSRGARAKHVAGSREHVAGGREHDSPRGRRQRQQPEGSDDGENPTAQELVAAFVDLHTRRPPGNVVGQVARHIRGLLEEGFEADAIRAALKDLVRRQLHPSTLPSLVNQHANPPAPLGAGEELTRARIDEILGPDLWQLPPAPMDPEDPGYRAWCRQTADEHRAERVREALARLEQVPT